MTKIYERERGDSTVEDMNELASFLLTHGFAETDSEDCGFQEISYALCDYEVHVVKKRKITLK